MATCKFILLLQLMLLVNSITLTIQENRVSLSFPLTTSSKARFLSSLGTDKRKVQNENSTTPSPPFTYNYKSSFKYSMALIVSLPIGTPPQTQSVVLDTGSQLSWIKCNRKTPKTASFPSKTTFDPSLSSTFSILPCNHPQCKPRTPDFTLPTTYDQNRLCHYSYFYADGTLAEGNLVREKFTFPGSRTTPPLILGCASSSSETEGIFGMNLGRLSFVSQANVPRFSYCVPLAQGRDKINPMGSFYLGENPNSRTFQYVDLLTLPESRRMPNFDPLAYTVGLVGIKIGGKKLNISENVFRPGASGSGQTVIDSGTQYTFLVEQAYSKVREEVVRLVGSKLKKGYAYGGALDMCFDGNSVDIRRLIGNMAFEFEKGVEILINKERTLAEVGDDIQCVAIGRSESLGISSNIIGNFHQQDLWVEFDVKNRRVGFGPADCSRSV